MSASVDDERPAPTFIPARKGRPRSAADRIGDGILQLLSDLPDTREAASLAPEVRSRAIADAAARKAAVIAGTLALPPGPLGWLTVLPELFAIWKIQAQMVADIAGAYGRHWQLTREQMLFCLFRHTAAQAFRDVAVRVGERWLVNAASASTIRAISRKIGVRLGERGAAHGIARWLPLVGAMGVGAYAWYDTRHVARTAINLFAVESAAGRAFDFDEGSLYD